MIFKSETRRVTRELLAYAHRVSEIEQTPFCSWTSAIMSVGQSRASVP